MAFYVTTENPNVMMRENHKTKSSEYIFICQDDIYQIYYTSRNFEYVERQIQDQFLSPR